MINHEWGTWPSFALYTSARTTGQQIGIVQLVEQLQKQKFECADGCQRRGKMHFAFLFVHFTSRGFHSSHFPPVIKSSLGWHVFIETFLDGIMGQLTGQLEQDEWQEDSYRTAWLTGWLNNARHPVVHPIIYPICHPISHPVICPLRCHAVISPAVHPVSCPIIGSACSSSCYLLVLLFIPLLGPSIPSVLLFGHPI